jgi:hypothetical protein
MRYHAGLGVGHVHTHSGQSSASSIPRQSRTIDVPDDSIPERLPDGGETQAPSSDMENEQNDETDNPEMALEDRENEGWEDVESDDSKDGNESDGQSSEDDDE